MREIIITANDAGRRLDRFLRKYLKNASLGEIYKLMRKDVKVDGRRRDESYVISEGEVLSLYISDEVLERMRGARLEEPERPRSGRGAAAAAAPGRSSAKHAAHRAKRQFRIIYEDEHLLVADKPYGLLTHGDSREKKDHLANQVTDYLIETGEYVPHLEKVFRPAPVNRLDRNTTGLVLFGKNSASLKGLAEMIREDKVDKYYMTIVHGYIDREMILTGTLTKDGSGNRVHISDISVSADDAASGDINDIHGGRNSGGSVVTIVRPLEHLTYDGRYRATLVEVQLVTGRSHQIRAHLAGIGHPVIGDSKYTSAGWKQADAYFSKQFRLTTQLLHAYRLVVKETADGLEYLTGRSFIAPLPGSFDRILRSGRSS